MGVMGKFRDNTGVILWILIGSFGLLWVVMDVFDPNALSAGPNAMGSVNGEPISFEEYNGRVQYYTNAYTQQTGASMNAETRALYEAQVWEDLVSARLLEQKMDELGITVTDKEVLDMAYGDNPDPLIRQYFAREDGSIDKFMVQNVLSDDQYSQEAIGIELQLREKRRQQKLSNFITAGLQVTEQDVQDEFIKRNSFAELSYIRFPYNEVDDAQITASDTELNAYYNENKESYKRDESYRATYVSFSTLPTSADSTEITKEVMDKIGDFVAAENDSLFLLRNQSTTPYSNVFIAKADIREEYAPVLDVEVGQVTQPINLGSSVAIIKKVAEKGNEVNFAVFSQVFEALPSTIDDAAENADEFQYFATEESSFEEEVDRSGIEAKEIFATKGSTFISGLGSSQQTMDFFRGADEGDVSDPIELGTEFVVIKLEEKTPEGFRPFEDVRAQIETQVKNNKRKQATLDKVNGMLTSNSSLDALATASTKEITPIANLAASSIALTGAGREPGVIGAVFMLKAGDALKAVEGINGVYVVEVKNITSPDSSVLDQATSGTIRTELEQQMNQRYLSIWLNELKEEADITDNRSRVLR